MLTQVHVDFDGDCEDPTEYDGWKIHSFNRGHLAFSDPFDLGFDDKGEPIARDLIDDLAIGRAFRLSYYEHGSCVWGLEGEVPVCRFDTVRLAGLIRWEAEDSAPDDAQGSARSVLKTYSDWCNGLCFVFAVMAVEACATCGAEKKEDPDCWRSGYIGFSGLVRDLRDEFGEGPFKFVGEAGDSAEYEFKLLLQTGAAS